MSETNPLSKGLLDVAAFEHFFREKGVPYSRHKGGTVGHGPEKRVCGWIISVSQAHFAFDKVGRFIGVEDDEMGNFREREE